jgi:hypothetical protein
MSLETTLAQVERDVAAGDLGKARDRLHGLLATYPDNLTVREQLGAIYWALRYPAMAGRYWYLVEEKSSEMEDACRVFERAFGGKPQRLLQAIHFRGNLEAIAGGYAGRTLISLGQRAVAKATEPAESTARGSNQQATVFIVSCLLILVAFGVLLIIGLITVIERFF